MSKTTFRVWSYLSSGYRLFIFNGPKCHFLLKVKRKEKGEVCWFTVLLDFWLETENCGLTCKITNWNLKPSEWRLFTNSISFHNRIYRASRGRWEAIMNRWNQNIVFPNFLTPFQQWRKEGKNKEEWREGGGRWREENGNIYLSSS